jgi:hypothetical protein
MISYSRLKNNFRILVWMFHMVAWAQTELPPFCSLLMRKDMNEYFKLLLSIQLTFKKSKKREIFSD